jgi:hypothetical protein
LTETRLFFAADVHGSETTFRKFLAAARYYKPNIVMLSGDITGKVLVPIVKESDGTYSANFLGSNVVAKNEEQLKDLEKNIRLNGQYPFVTSEDEKARLDMDPKAVDQIFSDTMVAVAKRWTRIAEEKLKDSGVKCLIMPGNDDRFELDSFLEATDFVVNPEGKVVQIDEFHEMISTGYSNISPWNCPRDIPEEKLTEKIDTMAAQVRNMKNCIFNFHCPPYDSGLDTAPELKELKPTGQMVPVGSHAVRRAIEEYQPMLSLHGHIHESQGFRKIGRTLCLNPGSEYSEGILRGVVINLSEDKVRSYLFTRG